jgi:hypothetical protein
MCWKNAKMRVMLALVIFLITLFIILALFYRKDKKIEITSTTVKLETLPMKYKI